MTSKRSPEARARLNAAARERYATDPEYRARKLERTKKYLGRPESLKKLRDRYNSEEEYRANMRARSNARARERRQSDPVFLEKLRESVRRWHRRAHGGRREAFQGQVDQLLQSTACQACGGAFQKTQDIQIDHCHSSGLIRGALCSPCNRALGCVGDSADRLRRLVAYISQFDRRQCEAAE